MNSDLELKKQFEAVSLELKEKESSIPESVSSLMSKTREFVQVLPSHFVIINSVSAI